MMPDLGQYTGAVLSSYTVSLGLIVALVVFSVWRSRRVRAELQKVEERVKNG